MLIKNVSRILLALSLASCGGGGGGGGDGGFGSVPVPAPPAPVVNEAPGGLWVGTATSVETGSNVEAEAISIDAGEFRIITAEASHFVGNLQVDGTNFTGFGTAYAAFGATWANGSETADLTVSGFVDERLNFQGNWTVSSGETGSFNFGYDNLYDDSSSLEFVADNWTILDEFDREIGSITIDGAGRLDGQDTAGCLYTGTVTEVDTNFNAYDLRVSILNCGELNGSYSGLGFLIGITETSDDFIYLIDKGTAAGVFYLRR